LLFLSALEPLSPLIGYPWLMFSEKLHGLLDGANFGESQLYVSVVMHFQDEMPSCWLTSHFDRNGLFIDDQV